MGSYKYQGLEPYLPQGALALIEPLLNKSPNRENLNLVIIVFRVKAAVTALVLMVILTPITSS